MATNRLMRCPYCNHTFTITIEQQINNSTFRCPKCKAHNQGSRRADNNGVLIGERRAYNG